MKLRIAGLVNDSIVDGEGLRLTVFTQGCPHHCPGCHNPQTHDPNGGHEVGTEQIIMMLKANPILDGLTLSGGDPFVQPVPCAEIAKAARRLGLNVWAYSGWTFEQLLKRGDDERKLLNEVDVLIDGRFASDLRSLECKWRGSTNQRIIDVQASLKSGVAVERRTE